MIIELRARKGNIDKLVDEYNSESALELQQMAYDIVLIERNGEIPVIDEKKEG